MFKLLIKRQGNIRKGPIDTDTLFGHECVDDTKNLVIVEELLYYGTCLIFIRRNKRRVTFA